MIINNNNNSDYVWGDSSKYNVDESLGSLVIMNQIESNPIDLPSSSSITLAEPSTLGPPSRSSVVDPEIRIVAVATDPYDREFLQILQYCLLVAAVLTLISILIYSIYYIILIRKIYAKERISD